MQFLFVSTFIPNQSSLHSFSDQNALCPRKRFPSTSISKTSMNPNTIRSCVEPPAWKRSFIDVDFARDEQLQILEEQLDDALTQQNFSQASTIRDKLLRLQSGSYVSVLSANLRFYRAFTSGSIVDMARCWLQDPGITCKHPLGPLATGYIDVINSFGYLFSAGLPSIQPSDVSISMRGSIAYVTCCENSTEWQEGESETAQSIVMIATNIFKKRNGEWYLLHHSALPVVGNKI